MASALCGGGACFGGFQWARDRGFCFLFPWEGWLSRPIAFGRDLPHRKFLTAVFAAARRGGGVWRLKFALDWAYARRKPCPVFCPGLELCQGLFIRLRGQFDFAGRRGRGGFCWRAWPALEPSKSQKNT